MLYQYSFTLHFYSCGFFTLLLLSVFSSFVVVVVFLFFSSLFVVVVVFFGEVSFLLWCPPPPLLCFFFFFVVAVVVFSPLSFFFICCGFFSSFLLFYLLWDFLLCSCLCPHFFSCLILICTLQWFRLSLIFCRAVTKEPAFSNIFYLQNAGLPYMDRKDQSVKWRSRILFKIALLISV